MKTNNSFFKNYEKYMTCLCQSCVEFYRGNPDYYVKRLTPPNGPKDSCDRCGRAGFDYIVCEQHERFVNGMRFRNSHNGRRAE